MADVYGTDMRLAFGEEGIDLAGGDGAAAMVAGVENLVQALTMRLLVDRGELTGIGHPRFGSEIRSLLGETLDAANMELLRRYVRKALLQDPRVTEVVSVTVAPRSVPGTVGVSAVVRAVDGAEAALRVVLDAG